jgi:hypothetical protein
LGLQRIHDVRVCHEFRWITKHLESFKTAYARAPYFGDHLPFIETTYRTGFEKLIEFNMAFIRYLFRQLKIETEIKLLSELGIQTAGNRMLVEICRRLGASVYLAQRAAAKYLDRRSFRQADVEIQFIKPPACVYPQLWRFCFQLIGFRYALQLRPQSARYPDRVRLLFFLAICLVLKHYGNHLTAIQFCLYLT